MESFEEQSKLPFDIKTVFSTQSGAGLGVSLLSLLICDLGERIDSASESEKPYIAFTHAYLKFQRDSLKEVMNSPEFR